MIRRVELIQHIDELLQSHNFQDYAPNGLQVAGVDVIRTLVSGVTASQALLHAAEIHRPDAILVHHGYFWKNDSPCLVGPHYRRICWLIQHDVNLIAYHLPLDAHRTLGNNRQLMEALALPAQIYDPVPCQGIVDMLWYADLSTPMSCDALAQHLEGVLQRAPCCVSAGDHLIRRVAWCTGGAQDFITQVPALQADAYISGEASERTCHQARELGIHFFAAGHHATERYGVQALGQALADRFDLQHHFIDIDNPI